MTEPDARTFSACKDFQPDLVLYYYDDSPEDMRSRVETHLKGCASCRRFMEELKTVLPFTVKPDDPPPGFWDAYSTELRDKLAGVETKGLWKTRLWSWLPAARTPAFALAGVLLLALSLTVGRGVWQSNPLPFAESELQMILGTKENMEFFESLELLESMELLESVDAGRPAHEAV